MMRVIALIAAGAFCIQSAFAKIKCEGQYQISGGNRISTPYCEDAYLASVARTSGSRTSPDAIRNSPFQKERVCAFVGADPRVRDICSGHYPFEGRGR